MHSRNHVEVGEYLKQVGSPSDVVVVNEIGAIGYYSGMIVYDMLGLTDRTVPRLMARESLDEYAEYLLSKNPRFIMLNNKQLRSDTKLHPLHQAVFDEMHSTGRYRHDRDFPLNDYKNIMLYVRDDSPSSHDRP